MILMDWLIGTRSVSTICSGRRTFPTAQLFGLTRRAGLGRQWRDPAADQAFSRSGDQRRAITAADCCKVRRATSPTLIVIFKPALFLRCPAFLTKVFK